MFFYNRSVGTKIQSETMKATAMDSMSDSIATTAVLVSMGIAYATGVNVDGWCGCLVACFVLYAGYGAAKDTLNPLLGEHRQKNLSMRSSPSYSRIRRSLGSTILWYMTTAREDA